VEVQKDDSGGAEADPLLNGGVEGLKGAGFASVVDSRSHAKSMGPMQGAPRSYLAWFAAEAYSAGVHPKGRS